MPENGSGRLDRIEANLERVAERMDRMSERFNAMVEHHDREFKQLMTWQVLMQDEVRKLAEEERAYREAQRKRDAERDEVTDARINKLVFAIGELVRRLPEPAGQASEKGRQVV
jgi:hypothetical protein